ncbi:TIR domain-containing protein [Staphylococcus felis]|uniref:TIR domain-containing protein n=1 Tax=Staphylococcus felis TaxID=46127 RepID=A0ABS0QQ93_9STAP|nr:TIR domain-containing protein [Staphylococcus felis]MBH9581431.1 TIR domain-containing protein [Staphylococcus felis]REI06881.1 signal transduction protein [Staphylococcus felis]REI10528.1 signal transduction protein [Staphylococcus felis]
MTRTIEEIQKKIINNNRMNTTYFHPITSNEEIAKYIAAYSNSSGGDIIFGIRDDGMTLSVKKFAFHLDIEKIQNLLEGTIKIKYNNITFNGNELFYISIDKSDELIKVNNVTYKINKEGNLEKVIKKKVFISYAHKDSDLVNILEKQLEKYENMIISRDINVTKYRDSLDEFMKTIREHDFVISVVSSAYINSVNCMYEVTQLMKDKGYQEKLFFIIVNSSDAVYYHKDNRYDGFEANIYDVMDRLKYITYWKDKKIELERSIKEADLPTELLFNLSVDMRKLNSVIPTMDDFIKLLSDKVGRSFKEMYENDFKEIVDSINK